MISAESNISDPNYNSKIFDIPIGGEENGQGKKLFLSSLNFDYVFICSCHFISLFQEVISCQKGS